MQFMGTPQYAGLPMDPYNGYSQGYNQGFTPTQNPYGMIQNAPQYIQGAPQRPQIDPRKFDTPDITMGTSVKPKFTITDNSKSNVVISVDNSSDMEVAEKKAKASGGKKKKKETTDGPIVKADNKPLSGEVENGNTIFTYGETNAMLHETLNQIDAINVELVHEFEQVKHNRTMKNKYMVLNNLSENIGSLISNRIATIREINNCISKSNDLDYKKYKDFQAANSNVSDDKYIADVYQALIKNSNAQVPSFTQMPAMDTSLVGTGIVRANVDAGTGAISDAGYLNYVANLTPEQNMMRYENNPNIKQVVVYDAATGNKFFQMMNVVTGEALNNVPTYDNIIMEDTTLDLQTKTAKNININESFPIIVINDNITSQY